ncbi:MAG: hypothetical protein HC902_01595 [Calothrix sp. SM1_5_4]|nr:hypothetical protein [Calothrix sp. SM1_5_4]
MLRANRTVSRDAEFYFQDADYAELRELVCYERPAAFVLHYYFGFRHSRLWLFDRFAFGLDESAELVNHSNALAEFFIDSKTIAERTTPMNADNFGEFLSESCSENSAVIVPYYSKVAGTDIVSSILVEGSGETILTTSLRGDAFHVRQPSRQRSLTDSLYLPNGEMSFSLLTVQEEVVRLGSLNAAAYAREINLKSRIHAALTAHLDRMTREPAGALALTLAFEGKKAKKERWINLAVQGFENVLLVRFFLAADNTPINHFSCSSPTLTGMECSRTLLGSERAKRLLVRIETVKSRAKRASNFAILFGKQPGDRFFNSFIDCLDSISRDYTGIEQEFIQSMREPRL